MVEKIAFLLPRKNTHNDNYIFAFVVCARIGETCWLYLRVYMWEIMYCLKWRYFKKELHSFTLFAMERKISRCLRKTVTNSFDTLTFFRVKIVEAYTSIANSYKYDAFICEHYITRKIEHLLLYFWLLRLWIWYMVMFWNIKW